MTDESRAGLSFARRAPQAGRRNRG